MALLETLEGIEVVGQGANGAQALKEVALTRPDVVVMDLRMPEVDGVEATRQIVREHPQTAVLVLTMFDEDQLISEALAAGARGYLLKGAEQQEIERAIRAVAAGNSIFSREVADRILRPRHARATSFPQLTQREREVLDLVARGRSNGVIAEELSISPKTVGNHISAIFSKLGVSTRAEAIVLARDARLEP